jgi:UDP-2-acetamido-2-deoxy-ribo-hexuluronate aminotransferase
MKPIPFIDLQAQQNQIRGRIEARIQAVLDHGAYIMGPEVAELEERLADFVGVKHCIGVASGTDALLMALMAYGVGPGDAIFTTPFTFVATSEVILLLGATPVFVDIDPRTFNLDPQKLEQALASFCSDQSHGLTARGIIPVDLFGLPADYDPIRQLADKNGLFVLEDAAQGLGGRYFGRQAGNLGDVAATSFFPAKPLGCYGDGGALFTADDQLADRLRSIRVHGKGGDKYENIRVGVNGRLDTLQAAILLPKLDIFATELVSRQRVADAYTEQLAELPNIISPHVPQGFVSAWAQYSLLVEDRDKFQGQLQQAGVPTAVYYPKPLHLQTVCAALGHREGDFPVAEKTARQIVSLPMHPYLGEENIARICNVIKSTEVRHR